MTDVRAALTSLGWRVDTSSRLTQAIRHFQGMWNLGDPLTVDGNAGPKTEGALAVSLIRKASGLGDISPNFSAIEFQCNCGDDGRKVAPDCDRIWTPRATVQLAERYRLLVGPFRPVRAGRCPTENRRVGGVPNSYHLTGKAIDVPVYKITIAQAHAIGANGVGYYTYGSARYVRHIDVRPSRVNPWQYPQSTRPDTVLTPRPDLAAAPSAPSPSEEDDMPLNDADKAWITDAIKTHVKAAFVEMSARKEPIDRSSGNAFWQLTRDASLPITKALTALGEGIGPAVAQGVKDAVESNYDVDLNLTKKESQ